VRERSSMAASCLMVRVVLRVGEGYG
jgi:hypothetical protein